MLQATLPFLTPPTESHNRPEARAGKARLHIHTHPAITESSKFATMGFLPLLPLPCEGAIGVMPMAAMYHSDTPSAIGAPKDFISHLKSHALPLLPAGCTIYQAPVPLRVPPRYYDEEYYEDDDDEDFDDNASVFSMLSTGSSASTAPDDEEPPFEATDDTTGETITVYTSLEQAARYSAARAERERQSQEDALLVAMPPSPTASPVASLFHFFPTVPGAVAAPAPTYDADDIDEDAYFSMG